MPADLTESPAFDRAAGQALLHWYETERRDLPWRRTQDPYRILVSEIMLQQTRVETVIPRYERFLQRFPDLQALAGADLDEVLAEWAGLGYYRRARALHAAAQAIVGAGDGSFPRTYDELRALPGIGDYTAAAVAAIAFKQPHVGIDGNVNRVLCRHFGIADLPSRASVRRQLRQAAETLLTDHPPGDVTQALIELGARVCTPRSPSCAACPIGGRCVAYAEGLQEALPVRRRQRIEEVFEAAAVFEDQGRFLLVRGQRPGVLQDMWEFPTLDSRLRAGTGLSEPGAAQPGTLADDLIAHLRRLGLGRVTLHEIGEIRHGITNRRITCTVYRVTATDLPAEADGRRWLTAEESLGLPLAASAAKTLVLLASA
jgi:A/G-specific adenine glycosylase